MQGRSPCANHFRLNLIGAIPIRKQNTGVLSDNGEKAQRCELVFHSIIAKNFKVKYNL